MRRTIILWGVLFGGLLFCPALQAGPPPGADRLKEARSLRERVHTLASENKYQEALPLAEKALHVWQDPAFGAAPSPAPDPVAARGPLARGFDFSKEKLPALPSTKDEALAIQKLLPKARLLLGPDASEAALLGLDAPGVLHLATHGLFLEDVPAIDVGPPPPQSVARALDLTRRTRGNTDESRGSWRRQVRVPDPLLRSALVLAGAAAGSAADGMDGLATALEVAGMNLWGTQLVVLSACNTGRGTTQPGQGVYGLRRSFFIAGAETLVASLWKVNDVVTTDLMQKYYQRLLVGHGRVEAMDYAAAQVREQHPHPFFWAPFIVLGRGDPIRGLGAAPE